MCLSAVQSAVKKTHLQQSTYGGVDIENIMIYSNMVIQTCDYCPYKSIHAWIVRKHIVKKHANIAPTSVIVPLLRRNHYGTGAPLTSELVQVTCKQDKGIELRQPTGNQVEI